MRDIQSIENQRHDTPSERKYSWEFIFLGANQDAFAEAAKIGIDEKHLEFRGSRRRDPFGLYGHESKY